MKFLDRPLDHWAQRTSKDVCRDACAIHTFKRTMRLADKALYVCAILTLIVLAIVLQGTS